MGDIRFRPAYERVTGAPDPAAEIRAMPDEEVIAALAAASRGADPLLANVLATEALNRVRRTRAVLENLGEGVLRVDPEARIRLANPAAGRILGVAEQSLQGVRLPDILRSEDGSGHARDAEGCCALRAIRIRRMVRCDAERLRLPDGTTRPVDYTAAPLLREGEAEGAVLVFRDVTERKKAERALRESEARWHALADAAFEGVVIHEGGHILEANRACAELFHVRREDVPGRSVMDFVAPSSRERASDAIVAGREGTYVLDCLRPDGSVFRAEARCRTIPCEGHAVHVVAFRPAEPGA